MALRDQIRIMVVDDMSTSRGLIVQGLEAMGVSQVSTAENGVDALTALAASPVHLIISDYHMPQMDGLQLLHSLRSAPQTAQTGFILVTGSADQDLVHKGASLGMNNYLPKPFDVPKLRDCIEAVVGRL